MKIIYYAAIAYTRKVRIMVDMNKAATNPNREATMAHFFATDLVGFRSTTLRVRVTERRDGHVWVITADLLDAGTKLVLADRQVQEVAR